MPNCVAIVRQYESSYVCSHTIFIVL